MRNGVGLGDITSDDLAIALAQKDLVPFKIALCIKMKRLKRNGTLWKAYFEAGMAEARARAAQRTTADLNILMRSDHRTEKLGSVY